MKYLITGKNGQLAQEFLRRLGKQSADVLAPDEASLDITNRKAVFQAVKQYKPQVIINCAAYNLVDNAEQDHDRVFAVNAEGPGLLAAAAHEHNALIVHFGSDYVFNGAKESGQYTEQDAVDPLNEYGKSKLAGEKRVIQESSEYLIFRLSWIFGSGKQNFIHKLIEWSRANEYLKVACDEFSVPTSTSTVVDVALKAVERNLVGLYHLTSSGYCSRYEWAKHILLCLGSNKFIRPVSMDSFNLPAPRPKFSAMSNHALSRALDITIPDWQEAVSSFLRERTLSNE